MPIRIYTIIQKLLSSKSSYSSWRFRTCRQISITEIRKGGARGARIIKYVTSEVRWLLPWGGALWLRCVAGVLGRSKKTWDREHFHLASFSVHNTWHFGQGDTSIHRIIQSITFRILSPAGAPSGLVISMLSTYTFPKAIQQHLSQETTRRKLLRMWRKRQRC